MQKIRKNTVKVLLMAVPTVAMALATTFAQLPQKNLTVVHAETSETLLTTITPTSEGSSQSPDGVATVATSGDIVYYYNDSVNKATWDARDMDGMRSFGTVTITPNEGFSISKCVFEGQNGSTVEDDEAPFTINIDGINETVTVDASDGVRNATFSSVASIKVYGSEIESYDLYVGDDEVTEAKLSGEGWAYTPATAETNAILTLDGVNISTGHESGSGPCAIYYAGSDPLDIVLEENSVNSLSNSTTMGFSGIDASGADLTISGKGKMIIDAWSYGIEYNNLVVNDASIQISSKLNCFGMWSFSSELTFNNADINVQASDYNPITASTLNVNNSTIVALGLSGSALIYDTLNLSTGMLVTAGSDADNAVLIEDVATWEHLDKWVKFAPKPADKTTLNTAIEEAEEYYNSIKDNTEYGSISAELSTAIDAAKEVAGDSDATQSEVDAAKTTLDATVAKAKADVKDYDDTKAAQTVVEKINALPNAGDVTLDDKEAIEAARAAYGALTADQKAKVSAETLKKLTDAEEALANLKPVELQKQNGLSGGAIAGIVIGSVFVVLLIACLVLFLLNKKGIINIPFLNKKQ